MTTPEDAYARAGVDIDAQDAALREVGELLRSTRTEGVLSGLGSFGGLFRPPLAGLADPVLVASADGVGTKLTVARLAGDYSTVGRDLVNHCVNDILVQGARPLFFLDYVGTGVLEAASVVELVRGVAAGCRDNGCALLGGETAEMPGFYQQGDYELVGFVVGLVDRQALLDGSRVGPGDVLLGLPSAGLHTNGFSLARRVFLEQLALGLDEAVPGVPKSLREVLLAPHLTYLPAVTPLLGHPALNAMAHITGGGLTDNLPRVLPPGTRARVDRGAWEVPGVFRALAEHGGIDSGEMYRVFNMGIGLVLIVDRERVAAVRQGLGDTVAFEIGEIEEGEGGVVYVGDDG